MQFAHFVDEQTIGFLRSEWGTSPADIACQFLQIGDWGKVRFLVARLSCQCLEIKLSVCGDTGKHNLFLNDLDDKSLVNTFDGEVQLGCGSCRAEIGFLDGVGLESSYGIPALSRIRAALVLGMLGTGWAEMG